MATVLVVRGPNQLTGNVIVSGSKNESLALLAGTVLGTSQSLLTNVPSVLDVHNHIACLRRVGCRVTTRSATVVISPPVRPVELVIGNRALRYRASILLFAAMVARFGCARMPLPGGCNLGPRPVRVHLRALEQLGAMITVDRTGITCLSASLRAADLTMNDEGMVSVTGTCCAIIGAVLARGVTHIDQAAQEPEVIALCRMLNLMGARIYGVGSAHLIVHGVCCLSGASVAVSPDRIEAGTWLVIGTLLGRDLRVSSLDTGQLESLISFLERAGASLMVRPTEVLISRPRRLSGSHLVLGPYPAISTDLHPLLALLLAHSSTPASLSDTVFPGRTHYAKPLACFGVSCRIVDASVSPTISGCLRPAVARATDCRAAAAVVAAAMAAPGTSIIHGLSNLDRGYEQFENKAAAVGAKIQRVPMAAMVRS